MSEPDCAQNPPAMSSTARLRARLPRLHLYQLPGYGPVYGWAQRFIHTRGRCVMVRGPVMDDGSRLWKCSWCGHRIADRPWTHPEKRLAAQAGNPS